MNTPDPVHLASSTHSAATAAAPTTAEPSSGTGGGLIAWLALFLAAAALAVALLVWQRWDEARGELLALHAQTQSQLRSDIEAASAQTSATQDSVREAATRLTLVEARLQEAAVQRAQLEELLQSLSRSRDETLAVDIEQTLLLARQHAQMTGSAQPLIAALKSGISRIARSAQPKLAAVHVAMQRDLERLGTHAEHDHAGLLARIDALRSQSHTWRLANDWPVSEPPRLSAQVDALPPNPEQTKGHVEPRLQPQTAAAEPAVENMVQSAPESASAKTAENSAENAATPDWHDRGLAAARSLWASVADLVRISRIDEPAAALIAPDQAYFLRENLQLKLLSARIAILSRQYEAARADLQAVRMDLDRWFDRDSAQVRAAAQTLAQLSEHMRANAAPSIEATLAALAHASSAQASTQGVQP